MKNLTTKKELLFIHHTNLDNKGARILAIIDNTTNIVFPDELNDPKILFAIGLTPDDLELCKEFFISI
jgi:hypothetical protein